MLREVEQKKIVVLVGINAPLFQVTRYATMHVEAKVWGFEAKDALYENIQVSCISVLLLLIFMVMMLLQDGI